VKISALFSVSCRFKLYAELLARVFLCADQDQLRPFVIQEIGRIAVGEFAAAKNLLQLLGDPPSDRRAALLFGGEPDSGFFKIMIKLPSSTSCTPFGSCCSTFGRNMK